VHKRDALPLAQNTAVRIVDFVKSRKLPILYNMETTYTLDGPGIGSVADARELFDPTRALDAAGERQLVSENAKKRFLQEHFKNAQTQGAHEAHVCANLFCGHHAFFSSNQYCLPASDAPEAGSEHGEASADSPEASTQPADIPSRSKQPVETAEPDFASAAAKSTSTNLKEKAYGNYCTCM